MTDIRPNLWKIYIYRFLSEFYLIVPILIPYYESNHLNSTQIFTIQASYALSVLILEIPSGYLADVIGRKKTLILGAFFLPVGIAVYAFTGSFYTFILAEFIVAVGNSMRSGCDSAFIYDTLIQLKEESEYKKFEGRSMFYTRLGTGLSSVGGGLFALLSLHLPFYINIGTSLFMLPLAISLIEPKRKKLEASNPLTDILRICRFCLSHGQLRRLMLFAALVMSTNIIGVWAYFLYYRSLGISIGYFGIIFAAFQLSSAFGSRNAHSLEKSIGKKPSYLILMLIAPTFLLLGLFQTILLIPLILLNAFLWGTAMPMILNDLNRLIKSEVRATIISVAHMVGSLSYVVLAPLFGKVVDTTSLSNAFLILGAYFIIYGSISLALILRSFQEESEGKQQKS